MASKVSLNMVTPPKPIDSNGLIATAREYLKYLYGLEILAGTAFVAANDDLAPKSLINANIQRRLIEAYRQEIKHAAQVHDMLKALGGPDKAELVQVMRWLHRSMVSMLICFPEQHRPYLRMLLNHLLESKLCQVGVHETWTMVQIIADQTGNAELRAAGQAFYDTVCAEEPDHIELDEEIIHVYRIMYPYIQRDAAMKMLRSHGTPFRRAIRAKREFVRAASASALSSSG